MLVDQAFKSRETGIQINALASTNQNIEAMCSKLAIPAAKNIETNETINRNGGAKYTRA